MIRFFKLEGDELVTVSEGHQLSVTMNSRFEVKAVRLKEPRLPNAEVAALEEQIARAVNAAVARVVKKLAERLAQTIDAGQSS